MIEMFVFVLDIIDEVLVELLVLGIMEKVLYYSQVCVVFVFVFVFEFFGEFLVVELFYQLVIGYLLFLGDVDWLVDVIDGDCQLIEGDGGKDQWLVGCVFYGQDCVCVYRKVNVYFMNGCVEIFGQKEWV